MLKKKPWIKKNEENQIKQKIISLFFYEHFYIENFSKKNFYKFNKPNPKKKIFQVLKLQKNSIEEFEN